MRMHLKWPQAEQYLKDAEQPMAKPTWYRWKAVLKQTMMDRLYEVAQYEFPEQHLQAIEEFKAGRKIMWENVLKVKDPFKQNVMIQNILNTLPLVSQYYESTKGVIEKPIESKEATVQESEQPAADQWV